MSGAKRGAPGSVGHPFKSTEGARYGARYFALSELYSLSPLSRGDALRSAQCLPLALIFRAFGAGQIYCDFETKPQSQVFPQRMLFRDCSGLNCARTFVIHENDASRTYNAFLHFERGRDRSLGKQLFARAQSYRIDHQPEIID